MTTADLLRLFTEANPDGVSETPSLSFCVFGTPQPAGSKRMVRNRATGQPYIIDDNPKSAGWKKQVREVAEDVRRLTAYPVLEGPTGIRVAFHLARPPSVARPHPTVRPDTTKLLRGLEDALTGVIWKDDAQIVYQEVSKCYTEEAPGASILVWPIRSGPRLRW